jgi:hypothetical protein
LILTFLLLFLIQSPTLAQSPSSPDDASLFHEGEILFSKGDTEKALWRFKRLTTDFPKSPLLNEAKFRMGICYTQLKRPKDAIEFLTNHCSPSCPSQEVDKSSPLLGDITSIGDPQCLIGMGEFVPDNLTMS